MREPKTLDPVLDNKDQFHPAANSSRPRIRQPKYLVNGAAIALAKGTPMLLRRTETALRGGNVPGAMTRINLARAKHALSALSASTLAKS